MEVSSFQRCPYRGVPLHTESCVHVSAYIPHPGYSSLLSRQSVVPSQNQLLDMHSPLSHCHWFEEQRPDRVIRNQ